MKNYIRRIYRAYQLHRMAKWSRWDSITVAIQWGRGI